MAGGAAAAESVPIRRARRSDLATLVAHRSAMWREIGGHSEAAVALEARAYRRWLRRALSRRRLVAWVATGRDGEPAGSGCLWFVEAQPRPRELAPLEPYLLSMYTHPAYRGRGIASAIVQAASTLARRRGYGRVTLHASEAGRPVYRRLGFERSWEMRRLFEENRAEPGARAAPPGPPRPRRRRLR